MDPIVRKGWNRNKTHVENLRSIGLCPEVNNISNLRTHDAKSTDVQLHAVPKSGVLEELEEKAAIPEAKAKANIAPGERKALSALYEKHRDDWEAMARDIKLNYLQWTPNQLQRKVERMKAVLRT